MLALFLVLVELAGAGDTARDAEADDDQGADDQQPDQQVGADPRAGGDEEAEADHEDGSAEGDPHGGLGRQGEEHPREGDGDDRQGQQAGRRASIGFISRLRMRRLVSGSPVARSAQACTAHSMRTMPSTMSPNTNSSGSAARPTTTSAAPNAATGGQ